MGLLARGLEGLAAHGAGRRPRPRPEGIDPQVPLEAAGYVVLDTELTGLNPRCDAIVSIGALWVDGGRILVGSAFGRVVRPRTELTGSSVVIHGITPADTRESPGIERVLPEFAAFCSGRILVGHAVAIDLAFVEAEARRHGAPPPDAAAVDTMALCRYLRRRTEERCAFREEAPDFVDLFTLAGENGIPVSRAHDALGDAYLTAQLFLHYLAVLPEHGVRTVGDLLRIGQP